MGPERKENEIQRWEYKTARLSTDLIDKIDGNKIPLGQRLHLKELLTQLGLEGWDLSTSLAGYHGIDATLIFKRPVGSQAKSSPETS